MEQLKTIWSHRKQIHYLATEQIKIQYSETSFGILWAVVNPMVYVLTFWFFFGIGLRNGNPVDGYPFLLWLFAGVMAFRMVIQGINSSTKVLTGNVVFIKTIKFPVMLLPIIEMLSQLYVHIAVMIIIFIVFVAYGGFDYAPDIYYLVNFPYYWITMLAFLVSIAIFLAALNVIIRDTAKLVSAITQPLFWLTPVLWQASGLLALIMKLVNPLYYFVLGYRETMLYEKFFFTEIWYDVYIWLIIILIFLVGARLWSNVRPVMADYL